MLTEVATLRIADGYLKGFNAPAAELEDYRETLAQALFLSESESTSVSPRAVRTALRRMHRGAPPGPGRDRLARLVEHFKTLPEPPPERYEWRGAFSFN